MSKKFRLYEGCGTLRKKCFSTRGYAEIHLQRPIFDKEEGIEENVVFKIQTVDICIGDSQTHTNLFFFKT
jgi:hypothetical protein